jgi:predicted ArsR family transcriptional regulator
MDRTADRLLHALKATGAQSAATLARRLGVTAVAVRQMLARLLAEGLVTFEDRRTSVGRPKRHWRLSDKGHGRFPDSHAGLTLELLNATEAVFGTKGLERLIAHREASTLALYRQRLAGARSLAERVRRLAKIRTSEGYMAEARRDGDAMLLIENHCPICVAAKRCQSLCRSELGVFEAALGADVWIERLDHIVAGARRCAYRITRGAVPG